MDCVSRPNIRYVKLFKLVPFPFTVEDNITEAVDMERMREAGCDAPDNCACSPIVPN